MTLAASGLVSIPLDALRRLIASSATFRTVTGAADATAAIEFIHVINASDEVTETDDCTIVDPRSRAIIIHLSEERTNSGQGEWLGEGTIGIAFEFLRSDIYKPTKDDDLASAKDKDDDAMTEFTNNLGAIKSEMETNSGGSDGTNGYLNMVGMALDDGPWPPFIDGANDDSDVFAATYVARWIG